MTKPVPAPPNKILCIPRYDGKNVDAKGKRVILYECPDPNCHRTFTNAKFVDLKGHTKTTTGHPNFEVYKEIIVTNPKPLSKKKKNEKLREKRFKTREKELQQNHQEQTRREEELEEYRRKDAESKELERKLMEERDKALEENQVMKEELAKEIGNSDTLKAKLKIKKFNKKEIVEKNEEIRRKDALVEELRKKLVNSSKLLKTKEADVTEVKKLRKEIKLYQKQNKDLNSVRAAFRYQSDQLDCLKAKLASYEKDRALKIQQESQIMSETIPQDKNIYFFDTNWLINYGTCIPLTEGLKDLEYLVDRAPPNMCFFISHLIIAELDGHTKFRWAQIYDMEGRSRQGSSSMKRGTSIAQTNAQKSEIAAIHREIKAVNEMLDYLKTSTNKTNLIVHTIANVSSELRAQLRDLTTADDKLLQILQHIRGIVRNPPIVLTSDNNFATKAHLLGCRTRKCNAFDILKYN